MSTETPATAAPRRWQGFLLFKHGKLDDLRLLSAEPQVQRALGELCARDRVRSRLRLVTSPAETP